MFVHGENGVASGDNSGHDEGGEGTSLNLMLFLPQA